MHISQISKRRISHPSQVLKVGDIVQVKVLEVDLERRRISLTMKEPVREKEENNEKRRDGP